MEPFYEVGEIIFADGSTFMPGRWVVVVTAVNGDEAELDFSCTFEKAKKVKPLTYVQIAEEFGINIANPNFTIPTTDAERIAAIAELAIASRTTFGAGHFKLQPRKK